MTVLNSRSFSWEGRTTPRPRGDSKTGSVDTGLTHLGTAFKRPTVALFGATCPYLRTPNPNTVVAYNPQACAPCKRKITCAGRYDCMNTITVVQVLKAVDQALRI
jgi:heptosyltransferase-1